jgi:GntR family transcriptional repressor for pyruvate dehydrogenase complex
MVKLIIYVCCMNGSIATLHASTQNGSAMQTVVERLARRILDDLKPGTQLPSEGALAQDFAVSRVTMREALKILSGKGLVTVSRGRRAVVRQPDGSVYGEFLRSLIRNDPKCLFDLLQVRRSLEIQSVIFAARHASRAGLAAIEAALQMMREAAVDSQREGDTVAAELRFHQADVGFHEAMALAGGNRVLTYLFEGMATPLLEAFTSSRRGQRLRGYSLEDSVKSHARIFQLVSAGDDKAASDAMTGLLNSAEADLRSAYAGLF